MSGHSGLAREGSAGSGRSKDSLALPVEMGLPRLWHARWVCHRGHEALEAGQWSGNGSVLALPLWQLGTPGEGWARRHQEGQVGETASWKGLPCFS